MSVLTAEGETLVLTAITDYLTAETITLYAALTKTVPTKASAGTAWTAPTGGARVAMAVEIDGDELHNTEVDFGTANAGETYVGINVYDAATAGNRIMFGPLASQVIVTPSQPVVMLAGAFKFSPDANT